jgi:hypothetical protein
VFIQADEFGDLASLCALALPLCEISQQHDRQRDRGRRKHKKRSISMEKMWRKQLVWEYPQYPWMSENHHQVSRLVYAFCLHLPHLSDVVGRDELISLERRLRSDACLQVMGFIDMGHVEDPQAPIEGGRKRPRVSPPENGQEEEDVTSSASHPHSKRVRSVIMNSLFSDDALDGATRQSGHEHSNPRKEFALATRNVSAEAEMCAHRLVTDPFDHATANTLIQELIRSGMKEGGWSSVMFEKLPLNLLLR